MADLPFEVRFVFLGGAFELLSHELVFYGHEDILCDTGTSSLIDVQRSSCIIGGSKGIR